MTMDVYQNLPSIVVDGLTFAAGLVVDDTMRAPWEEHDGHGVVSGWESRSKRPGERVLNSDRFRKRFYDVQASMERARAEGWGIAADRRASWEARIGRPLTRGEVAAAAVEDDFKRLKDWCDDRWHWCGVVVTLLDVEGEETNSTASLWGIESDAGAYLEETARELAGELASGISGDTIEEGARAIRVRAG